MSPQDIISECHAQYYDGIRSVSPNKCQLPECPLSAEIGKVYCLIHQKNFDSWRKE